MLPKLAASAITVLAVGLTACGSSSSNNSAHKPRSARSRPSRIYSVQMTGAAEGGHGAPQAAGAAVIAFHGESTVCWRFAHLRGFTSATVAHIHTGAKGRSGGIIVALSTGPRLRHRGCARVSPATTKKIWRAPGQYYVNIHSTQYPQGAVRGQL